MAEKETRVTDEHRWVTDNRHTCAFVMLPTVDIGALGLGSSGAIHYFGGIWSYQAPRIRFLK